MGQDQQLADYSRKFLRFSTEPTRSPKLRMAPPIPISSSLISNTQSRQQPSGASEQKTSSALVPGSIGTGPTEAQALPAAADVVPTPVAVPEDILVNIGWSSGGRDLRD